MSLRTAIKDTKLIAELLTAAETEARDAGDEMPGAEHLLIAALASTDDSARVALGVDAPEARSALTELHHRALAGVGVENGAAEPLGAAGGPFRSEVSLREVFGRMRLLAKHSSTGLRSAHALIAVAEREHGTSARLLDRLGADRGAVLAAATAVVS